MYSIMLLVLVVLVHLLISKVNCVHFSRNFESDSAERNEMATRFDCEIFLPISENSLEFERQCNVLNRIYQCCYEFSSLRKNAFLDSSKNFVSTNIFQCLHFLQQNLMFLPNSQNSKRLEINYDLCSDLITTRKTRPYPQPVKRPSTWPLPQPVFRGPTFPPIPDLPMPDWSRLNPFLHPFRAGSGSPNTALTTNMPAVNGTVATEKITMTDFVTADNFTVVDYTAESFNTTEDGTFAPTKIPVSTTNASHQTSKTSSTTSSRQLLRSALTRSPIE